MDEDVSDGYASRGEETTWWGCSQIGFDFSTARAKICSIVS